MRIKVYILVVLVLALFVMPIAARAPQADSEQSREYQIKVAFLYNFIKFVDWPKEKIGNSNEPIIIGICYHENHIRAFESLQGRKVKGRRVVVKPFGDFEELKESGEKDKAEIKRQIEALRKCHLFFICSPRKNNVGEIIEALKGSSILTVGETAGFLESGGIINFIMEEKKVRFEVNITAAERAKLKIRSKLLRLAKRVVEEDKEQDNKNRAEASEGAGS